MHFWFLRGGGYLVSPAHSCRKHHKNVLEAAKTLRQSACLSSRGCPKLSADNSTQSDRCAMHYLGLFHNFLLCFRSQDLKLMLTEKTAKGKQSNEYMGYLTVQCTLIPKTQDEKEQVSRNFHFYFDFKWSPAKCNRAKALRAEQLHPMCFSDGVRRARRFFVVAVEKLRLGTDPCTLAQVKSTLFLSKEEK